MDGAPGRLRNEPNLGAAGAARGGLPEVSCTESCGLCYLAGMRKTTFVGTLFCCFSLICLLTIGMNCLPAFTQDAAPAAASVKGAPVAALPSDPKELMMLAAKTNGLTGDDVKPWHLRATWKMFDEKGSVTDQGTYEEFWVSWDKNKRTFTGAAFTETDYGTEKGVLRTGTENEPPHLVREIRRQFVGPMQDAQAIERENFDLQQRELGAGKFSCLSMKDAMGYAFGPTWCLSADKPILRIAALSKGTRIGFNRILSFQGRFVAGDLQFAQQSNLVMTVHLDSLESIATIDDALFVPPPDAVPPMRKIVQISADVMRGAIISKTVPEYPPIAKAAHVSGTVVLEAVIGKDGKIENLHAISGPAMLHQAALDAVRQWVYRPYLLNDEPVEVKTTVNVTFSLGNR
jgi:TonB family protein